MDIKNKTNWLDAKTLIIMLLSIAILIIYFAASNGYIFNNKTEIDKLHKENSILLTKNDSIKELNNELSNQIGGLEELTYDLHNQLDSANLEIKRLKRIKNEIPTKVNRMSANSVANEFSKYLETKDKSSNASHQRR